MESLSILQQSLAHAEQCLDTGNWSEAESIFKEMLAQYPPAAEIQLHLSIALKNQGKIKEAIAALRAALTLKPDLPEGWNNLGVMLRDLNQPEQAIEIFHRATRMHPDFASAWNNLAGVLKSVGRLDEALECFDRAIALKPDHAEMHGSRLCAMHYHPGFDAATLFAATQVWNDRFARPLLPRPPRHDNDPTPERRLRVGYVSPDFHYHCQTLFTPPFLAHHDHERFEIFCYSNVRSPDSVTTRLQAYANVWRDISMLNDQDAAQLIRADKIDILIDLTLHTAGNRLLIFARKPAPVQVTWLGYPGTTGLEAIDYRLTDARLDPIEEQIRNPKSEIRINDQNPNDPNPNDPRSPAAVRQPGSLPHIDIGKLGFDSDFGFRISDFEIGLRILQQKSLTTPSASLRLPTFWCYDPCGVEEHPEAALAVMPDPGPLPALSTGHITLGCLNNFCKITDATLALWAPVLAALPNSSLLLLAAPGVHRQHVAQNLGVAPQRLQFVPFLPRREYLETYRRIDVCLDTIPYNGHTTSLDALWMGVPVVTRVGRTVVGRAGWSQLHHVGLEELVASSDEQFVQTAIALAQNLDRLSSLRAALRARMRQSPLMDGPRMARSLEGAYRQMWQAWCHNPRT